MSDDKKFFTVTELMNRWGIADRRTVIKILKATPDLGATRIGPLLWRIPAVKVHAYERDQRIVVT